MPPKKRGKKKKPKASSAETTTKEAENLDDILADFKNEPPLEVSHEANYAFYVKAEALRGKQKWRQSFDLFRKVTTSAGSITYTKSMLGLGHCLLHFDYDLDTRMLAVSSFSAAFRMLELVFLRSDGQDQPATRHEPGTAEGLARMKSLVKVVIGMASRGDGIKSDIVAPPGASKQEGERRMTEFLMEDLGLVLFRTGWAHQDIFSHVAQSQK